MQRDPRDHPGTPIPPRRPRPRSSPPNAARRSRPCQAAG